MNSVVVLAFALPVWLLVSSVVMGLWSLFVLIYGIRKTRKGADDPGVYAVAALFAVFSLGLFIYGVATDDTDIRDALGTAVASEVDDRVG